MSIAFDHRPSRSDIEPVALDLIQRRGAEVLATARRHAVSAEDAEDAYQRALEILLTKAPTTDETELLSWLKVVVKHEAYALRRKRDRDVPAGHDALDALADEVGVRADERAERYDRLRVGAEALAKLKPQETTCLLLKAEGLSYREIAARTGFTYTKVNRCLVEGRRAFVARVEGIESGAECDRMAPLLSALADGEASAVDMAALRPHLRGCASCRATLREYREAPRRVAGLAAPLAVGGVLASLGDRLLDAAAWVKAAVTPKVAVVALSTVAVAGSGAAAVQAIDRAPERAAGQQPALVSSAAKQPVRASAPAVHSAAARSAGAAVPTRWRRHGARIAPRTAAARSTPSTPATRTAPPSTQSTAAASRPTAPANGAVVKKPAPAPVTPAAPPGGGASEFGP